MPLHTPKTLEMCKKSSPWWVFQGAWQIARLKQRFLSPNFYDIQRSYEKILCICYFISSVVKIALYLQFFDTKDRLQQIKKKHE